MKKITIISGKGGTGKTTVTAFFSMVASNKVIVDCDVDASNLHLILKPKVKKREDFYSGKKATINSALCKKCGKCSDICRFDAINYSKTLNKMVVDKLSCTGCGACTYVCPKDGISLESNKAGEWFLSSTNWGPMVHARLGIAEDNSGKLVSFIRSEAEKEAEENNYELILVDGPPGIGCPVIAAISGTDLVLIVAEPTESGLHDALRAHKVALGFKIPTALCINKYDLNKEMSQKIKEKCKELKINYVGEIPFDERVVEALASGGEFFLDSLPPKVLDSLKNIWEKTKNLVI